MIKNILIITILLTTKIITQQQNYNYDFLNDDQNYYNLDNTLNKKKENNYQYKVNNNANFMNTFLKNKTKNMNEKNINILHPNQIIKNKNEISKMKENILMLKKLKKKLDNQIKLEEKKYEQFVKIPKGVINGIISSIEKINKRFFIIEQTLSHLIKNSNLNKKNDLLSNLEKNKDLLKTDKKNLEIYEEEIKKSPVSLQKKLNSNEKKDYKKLAIEEIIDKMEKQNNLLYKKILGEIKNNKTVPPAILANLKKIQKNQKDLKRRKDEILKKRNEKKNKLPLKLKTVNNEDKKRNIFKNILIEHENPENQIKSFDLKEQEILMKRLRELNKEANRDIGEIPDDKNSSMDIGEIKSEPSIKSYGNMPPQMRNQKNLNRTAEEGQNLRMQRDPRMIQMQRDPRMIQNPNMGQMQGDPRMMQNPNMAQMQRDPRMMQNQNMGKMQGDPRMMQRDSRMMQRDPRIMQKDPRMIQGDPGMMQGDPRMIQMQRDPRMIQNPNMGQMQGDPRMMQNPNMAQMQRDPRMMQNQNMGKMQGDPRMMQRDPRMMQRDPNMSQQRSTQFGQNPNMSQQRSSRFGQNPNMRQQRGMQQEPRQRERGNRMNSQFGQSFDSPDNDDKYLRGEEAENEEISSSGLSGELS